MTKIKFYAEFFSSDNFGNSRGDNGILADFVDGAFDFDGGYFETNTNGIFEKF